MTRARASGDFGLIFFSDSTDDAYMGLDREHESSTKNSITTYKVYMGKFLKISRFEHHTVVLASKATQTNVSWTKLDVYCCSSLHMRFPRSMSNFV